MLKNSTIGATIYQKENTLKNKKFKNTKRSLILSVLRTSSCAWENSIKPFPNDNQISECIEYN